MYIDRIVESSFDFTKEDGALLCPNCNEQLGARITTPDHKKAYSMVRSMYHTTRI